MNPMSYAAALEHLYQLGVELAPATPSTPRRKFELEHMRILAEALGNPQSRFPSVLIAGTNGKGSTAATLASILTAAGYRTGLYTSPHLIRVNERIQISAPLRPTEYASADVPASAGPSALHQIPDDEFARLYFHVDDVAQRLVHSHQLPHHPSFFEVLTAVAFCYFAGSPHTRPVDIAILEVGLGGRLDATNIVDPLLSIITDIALDHQDYLGNTIAAITREKAGILRPNGTLITLPQHPEANQTIGELAPGLNLHAVSATSFIPPTRDYQPNPEASSEEAHTPLPLAANHYTLTLDNDTIEVDSPLPGQHQQRNLALAIAAAVELRNPSGHNKNSNQNRYNITNANIATGIRNTFWPGRLEFLPPNLLLDVAHNPAGAWTLRAAIAQLPSTQPRTLIFSCLRDKSLAEMAQILLPLFDSTSGDPDRAHDHIILAPINSPRASSVDELLAAAHALDIPAHAAPHLAGALAQAREITPSNGIILATGSVYLVGEIRELAAELPA
jgi:dihydrofolate synthase/folylpolyglutamate synthase